MNFLQDAVAPLAAEQKRKSTCLSLLQSDLRNLAFSRFVSLALRLCPLHALHLGDVLDPRADRAGKQHTLHRVLGGLHG